MSAFSRDRLKAVSKKLQKKLNTRRYRAELEELARALEASHQALASKLDAVTTEASGLWTVRRQLEEKCRYLSDEVSKEKARNEKITRLVWHLKTRTEALEATLKTLGKKSRARPVQRHPNDMPAVQTYLVEASGLFDSEFYLANNPDVRGAKCDPATHYTTAGGREGRAASVAFNSRSYLENNPDVTAAGINPLVHFILHGVLEDREFEGKPPILRLSELAQLPQREQGDLGSTREA